MKRSLAFALISLTAAFAPATAQTPPDDDLPMSRRVVTRDPSDIVKCGDTYWVFHTGKGIPSLHSKDLLKWEPGPAVFSEPPAWITESVPGNKGGYWAPSVRKVGDKYFLYYSVSTMGAMRSAIGLATNPTLDPASPGYKWTDHGPVVESRDGGNFNAIDPSVFQDDDGSLWLVFGSQWSGIQLIQLDPETGKRIARDSPQENLADAEIIEGGFLTKHDGYYYLFLNWGTCCSGVDSTYNIVVGRSKKVTGPYVDDKGVGMLYGGGRPFIPNKNGPLIGPGHAGILEADGKTWFTCCFEGNTRMEGKATLALMPLHWTEDGWPVAEMK